MNFTSFFTSGRNGLPRGMHSKRVAIAGSTLVALLTLSACGGSDTSSSEASEGVDQEAAELLQDDFRDTGTLTVGTYAPSPPTRMFEDDGTTLTGMEIDMVQEVGDALGLEVEFVNMNWDGLLPALSSGRFDMVAAQVGDYEDRREHGDFVDYYTHTGTAVVLAKNADEYDDRWDLCGKKVGYQSGVAAAQTLPEISEECETENPEAGPMQLNPFPDDAAGLLAIRSGQSDVHVADSTPVAYQIEQSKSEGDGEELAVAVDDLVERGNIGLVISKDNPELRDAVKTALQNMHDSGRYQEVLDDYGVGDYAVEEITVNTTKAVK